MDSTCQIEVVKFHGDEIEVTGTGEEGMVVLHRLCDNIGVDYPTQLRKLKERSWATVGQKPTVDPAGRTRLATCIDMPTMHGWLVSLNENKVKPEAREKLVIYQREAVKVLARHFNGAVTAGGGPSLPHEPPPTHDPAIAQLLAIVASTARCNESIARANETNAETARLIATRVHVPTHSDPPVITTERVEEVAEVASTAHDLAASAVHIQTGSHSSCSVMGYGRITGRQMDEREAKGHGSKIAAKMRAEGRGEDIGKTSHQRYGGVNTYPLQDLAEHFGDDMDKINALYAAMG